MQPSVTELRLHGVHRYTTRDENLGFYQDLLARHGAQPGASSLRAGARDEPQAVSSEELLARHGFSVFYRGLSHEEFKMRASG